jgi:MraZ protein
VGKIGEKCFFVGASVKRLSFFVMARFIGEYDATLDSKGRFLLPAGLRKIMPEGTAALVVNRGLDDCLNLYLPEDWKQVEDRLSQVNPYDSRENRMIRKALIAGAVYLDIDSAGRLNIPKKLADYASLEKDLVLAGDIEKIEIWDKTKYDKLFEALTPEKVTAMSAQVLGSGANQGNINNG